MAWTKTTANKLLLMSESYTLPSSATTGYSTVIKEVGPDSSKETQNVTFTFLTSALSTGNLDMQLWGSDTEAGTTKFLLKDTIVTDIVNGDGTSACVIDLNDYPAPYYFIGWLAAGDEDANTITVKVMK